MSDPSQLPRFRASPAASSARQSPTRPARPTRRIQLPGIPDLTPPTSPIVVVSTPYVEYAIVKTVFDWSGLDAQAVQGPPGTPADPIRGAPRGDSWWCAGSPAAGRGSPRSRRGPSGPRIVSTTTAGSPGPGRASSSTAPSAYRSKGLYVWKLLVPYKETDTLVVAAFPFANESAANNAVTPDMYDADILGPNQPPAGAPPIRSISDTVAARRRGGDVYRPELPRRAGLAGR